MTRTNDQSVYVNNLYMQDLPLSHAIVFYDQERMINGNRCVLCECPACHIQRWIRKTYIKGGHTKSTYCSAHRNVPLIEWVQQGEFDDAPDICVDYTQQKASESAHESYKRVVFILGICPDCRVARWVRIQGLRSRDNTTLCRSCAKKRCPQRRTSGEVLVYGGYRYIHIRTLAERYTPEQILAVQTHLRVHKKTYYPEHRVVALFKYGELFFAGGVSTVVRHINGDKLDNREENLLLGTQGQNVNDHTTDRKLAKKWEGIARDLAQALLACLVLLTTQARS